MPIYVVQSLLTGHVKIGWSADIVKRIRGLQTSHPGKLRLLRVLDATRDDEPMLHRRFTAHRGAGEWFAPLPEIISGDLGLSDLPIPPPGRRSSRKFPDTTAGREAAALNALIGKLGGNNAVACEMGVTPSAVSHWRQAGIAPQDRQLELWRLAVLADIDWKPPGITGVMLVRDVSDSNLPDVPVPQECAA